MLTVVNIKVTVFMDILLYSLGAYRSDNGGSKQPESSASSQKTVILLFHLLSCFSALPRPYILNMRYSSLLKMETTHSFQVFATSYKTA